jgi:hypothetical protein
MCGGSSIAERCVHQTPKGASGRSHQPRNKGRLDRARLSIFSCPGAHPGQDEQSPVRLAELSPVGPWHSPRPPPGTAAHWGSAAFPWCSPPGIGFRARPRQLSKQVPPRRSRSSAAVDDPEPPSMARRFCNAPNQSARAKALAAPKICADIFPLFFDSQKGRVLRFFRYPSTLFISQEGGRSRDRSPRQCCR